MTVGSSLTCARSSPKQVTDLCSNGGPVQAAPQLPSPATPCTPGGAIVGRSRCDVRTGVDQDHRPNSARKISSETLRKVRVTARETANEGFPRCSLFVRPLVLRNELQLHTIVGVHVHTWALQLIRESSVYAHQVERSHVWSPRPVYVTA